MRKKKETKAEPLVHTNGVGSSEYFFKKAKSIPLRPSYFEGNLSSFSELAKLGKLYVENLKYYFENKESWKLEEVIKENDWVVVNTSRFGSEKFRLCANLLEGLQETVKGGDVLLCVDKEFDPDTPGVEEWCGDDEGTRLKKYLSPPS